MKNAKNSKLNVIKRIHLGIEQEFVKIIKEQERLEHKQDRTLTEESTLAMLNAHLSVAKIDILFDVQKANVNDLYNNIEKDFNVKTNDILARRVSFQTGLMVGFILFLIERVVSVVENNTAINEEWILTTVVVLGVLSLLYAIENIFFVGRSTILLKQFQWKLHILGLALGKIKAENAHIMKVQKDAEDKE